jgi:hypothetical protein
LIAVEDGTTDRKLYKDLDQQHHNEHWSPYDKKNHKTNVSQCSCSDCGKKSPNGGSPKKKDLGLNE